MPCAPAWVVLLRPAVAAPEAVGPQHRHIAVYMLPKRCAVVSRGLPAGVEA